MGLKYYYENEYGDLFEDNNGDVSIFDKSDMVILLKEINQLF